MRPFSVGHGPVTAAIVLAALAAPCGALAQALPFLAPGDARLRHMVELDGDSGQVPLSTTWPLPTFDLPAEERDKLRGYNQPGSATDAGWFLSGAVKPMKLRTFDDTPREKGEAGLEAGWAAGDYAGGAIRISYAFSPQDGMHYRLDGTYVAWRYGNWWLTAGVQDRWWGPGWDSSLILSSNARPMPGLALERASSLPPESALLRWIGPWRFVTFVDHMENHRADFDNTLFWGARLTFKPLRSVEMGLSRTAEFCGRGRSCGLGTFWDVLIAKSNRKLNPVIDNTGNTSLTLQKQSAQRWAGDIRWRPTGTPLALYWQEYGEVFDSGNYRPRQTLQLFGAEIAAWGIAEGRYRGFLEFADTACGDISVSASDKPNFGCAYEKDTWREGYRYRGRAIGDSMDRDGRRFTLGFVYTDSFSQTWDIRLRMFDLNRGGIANAGLVPQTVTSVAERLWNAEVAFTGVLNGYRFSTGIGADYGGPQVVRTMSLTGRAFLQIGRDW